MGVLDKLESQLDDVLNKKAPFKLPPSSRKNLAGAMWWIALVVGVLQLWAVWALWHLGHLVNQLVNYGNYLSATYGYATPAHHLGLFYWLSWLVLAADAVILLVAAPALKQMNKSGWNLLFYSALLNAAYGILRMFSSYGDFGSLVWAVIGSAVGAYFLFQVRDYFTGKKAAHSTPAAPHHTK